MEKTLRDEEIAHIKGIVEKHYNSYKCSDMCVKMIIHDDESGTYRNKILQNKFHEFQTSELVVTDRLHGMIFAAITETPCIAFSNFNHKIVESYEWLKKLKYIKFCNNISEFENMLIELKDIKNTEYDSGFAMNKIISVLKEEIG